jgi:hypothetical protein
MLRSTEQIDATANTMEKFVALLARAAEPGHRYDVRLEVMIACPLVVAARNLG